MKLSTLMLIKRIKKYRKDQKRRKITPEGPQRRLKAPKRAQRPLKDIVYMFYFLQERLYLFFYQFQLGAEQRILEMALRVPKLGIFKYSSNFS